MTDYIDRAALMRLIEEEAREWGPEYDALQILGDIEDFPPADVRPVVLCKNCRYCIKIGDDELWCNGFCHPSRLVRPDDYCSHGEEAAHGP